MSTKNFVSYGDAETLFTGVGNKISGKQAKPTTISYADWLLLTPQQQETGNWLVTGVPGADLSLRVLALETNKQDKTDNNLQTESKETTGAINELKSGLTSLYLGNPTSVTEKVLECLADDSVNYTIPNDGWYRVILINNNNNETSLRLNDIGFMYLDSTGKLDAVIPFKKGALLSASVVGNGKVWVNKYNFGS